MGAPISPRAYRTIWYAVLIFLSLRSVSSGKTWFEKSYGGSGLDRGFQAIQTEDGGYVVVGETCSFGVGGSDVYLVKTDSLGDTLWTATYGGDSWDLGTSVVQTQDGGYAITGYTKSFGLMECDVYLIKTDPHGDMEWYRTFGGEGDDAGWSIVQTDDGGYLIVGYTASFGLLDGDVYLVRTDSFGNLQWTETYGGGAYDIGRCVRRTQDGGYIIAGSTRSFAPRSDFYLIKTDSLGAHMWSSAYGGEDMDEGYSVDLTQDGGYVIAGWTESFGAGDEAFFVIRTDSLGNTVWTRTPGGPGGEHCYSVDVSQDGGYALVGAAVGSSSEDNVYIVKMTPSGDVAWESRLGGIEPECGYSIEQTRDGGYIIAGMTESFGFGQEDVLLIKTDDAGIAPEYDVTVAGIDQPGGLVQPDSAYQVKATVRSLGNVESSFSVAVEIGEYYDTVRVRRLPPDSAEEVLFRPWHVPGHDSVEYDIHACALIADDQNPANDCRRKRVLAADTLAPVILSAVASDNIDPFHGIDDDDYVLLTFSEKTNKPPLSSANMDTVISLNNGHSWLDGDGELGRAEWNFIGDMLLITLSTHVSPPTVAVGDTLTLDGVTITDIHDRPSSCRSVIGGSFDPVGILESAAASPCWRPHLLRNRPNPFATGTWIRYDVGPWSPGTAMPVQMTIHDVSGRIVEILVNQDQSSGRYETYWRADGCPAGVYFCRLEAGDFVDVRKMTLVR